MVEVLMSSKSKITLFMTVVELGSVESSTLCTCELFTEMFIHVHLNVVGADQTHTPEEMPFNWNRGTIPQAKPECCYRRKGKGGTCLHHYFCKVQAMLFLQMLVKEGDLQFKAVFDFHSSEVTEARFRTKAQVQSRSRC
ncbi:uncharacterized protein LOC124706491 [Lolium rigidum]|uniref:uncharacterized protein LOC124706491 n=1 Tax=Lolium rigidum TaxID=89674 RepID=UPI001F5DAFC4|nr:uncharacterized protein LOC124706491 [Lolium rigidum]